VAFRFLMLARGDRGTTFCAGFCTGTRRVVTTTAFEGERSWLLPFFDFEKKLRSELVERITVSVAVIIVKLMK
jgi:hypothetical protein